MATETQVDFSKLLTPHEVAAELDLALSTVKSMISRGIIDSEETRLGRFVHLNVVIAYKEERLGKFGRKRKSL